MRVLIIPHMNRLVVLLLGATLLGLAALVIVPVAATILTPGWIDSSDGRDWASMGFFLSAAAVLILVGLRLGFRRARSVRGLLRSRDWWAITVLATIATICAAIASHWTISLPGLLPIGVAVLFARRRARQERLVLVEPDPEQAPPRPSFTMRESSGPRSR
jgi:hypothetical protein